MPSVPEDPHSPSGELRKDFYDGRSLKLTQKQISHDSLMEMNARIDARRPSASRDDRDDGGAFDDRSGDAGPT